MQFTQRVLAVWSWLPAFRAVAETEHLPTAARELGLVPSSLSRSIKLLEESIQTSLFDHRGKSLVLNDAGRRLLTSVRHAMRVLDDAVRAVNGSEMLGTVVAAVSSDLSSTLLAPACRALHYQHPGLEVTIRVIVEDEIADRLLSGEIDVAVVSRLLHAPNVTTVDLATRRRSAYTAARTTPSSPPRCVLLGTRANPRDDGWPHGVEREIGFWAHDPAVAFELCLAGDLVMTATDAEAAAFGDRLVKWDIPAIRDQVLYLMHRPTIGSHPRTEALVAAIHQLFPSGT